MRVTAIRKNGYCILKGRRKEAASLCFLLIFTFYSMKLLKFIAAYVFLNVGIIKPNQLLGFSSSPWNTFNIVYTIVSFALLIPFWNGVCWWFTSLSDDKHEPASVAIKLFVSKKLCLKSYILYSIIEAIRLLLLTANLASFYGAYRLFLSAEHSPLMLFWSVQLSVLGILLFAINIAVFLSLMACPYIFLKNPMKNPLLIVSESISAMRGRKTRALLLLFSYAYLIPLLIFPLTSFMAFSEIMSGYAVFITDTVNLYEYRSSIVGGKVGEAEV